MADTPPGDGERVGTRPPAIAGTLTSKPLDVWRISMLILKNQLRGVPKGTAWRAGEYGHCGRKGRRFIGARIHASVQAPVQGCYGLDPGT